MLLTIGLLTVTAAIAMVAGAFVQFGPGYGLMALGAALAALATLLGRAA